MALLDANLSVRILDSASGKPKIQITSDFSEELKSQLSALLDLGNEKVTRPSVYFSTNETLTVLVNNQKITLTPRTQEILAYLLTEFGRVVPNTELVRKVLRREPDEEAMLTMRVCWYNLKEELSHYGIDYIAHSTRSGRGRYLNMAEIMSDLHHMFSGYQDMLSALYINNYLSCYDWAEPMRHKLIRVAAYRLKKAA